MLQADNATVEWNTAKKHWEVHILVGAETIKRPVDHLADTGEAALKELACATARDEGYEIDPDRVTVKGQAG
jgi:hypothetical protein